MALASSESNDVPTSHRFEICFHMISSTVYEYERVYTKAFRVASRFYFVHLRFWLLED